LLSILIAMVMQVIDDRVARAFSLVGALSIVRFRTVLDDTQDIAFVIFSVVVGMAAGTGALGVAMIGSLVMIGTLCFARLPVFGKSKQPATALSPDSELTLRIAVGQDFQQIVAPMFESHLSVCKVVSVETVRGGSALEWVYSIRLNEDTPLNTFVEQLTKVEGIQNVSIKALK
jgi:uncharacterized membrane protein YhiD involved in acid resistance